jgi:hypothetical protein
VLAASADAVTRNLWIWAQSQILIDFAAPNADLLDELVPLY